MNSPPHHFESHPQMKAIEFDATVQNGSIALRENQQHCNGKNIKVILLDVPLAIGAKQVAQSDDFFGVAGIWAQRDNITQESLRRAAWRADTK